MNINSNIPKKIDLQRFSEHAFSTEMAVGAIVASAFRRLRIHPGCGFEQFKAAKSGPSGDLERNPKCVI